MCGGFRMSGAANVVQDHPSPVHSTCRHANHDAAVDTPSDRRPRVYQFRVVVQDVSPLIWRWLLIRSDMSLATLHTML
jgi:hypothetical protein